MLSATWGISVGLQRVMKTPPPWQDEKRRLEVLWQYEVLGTPPEEAFDTLTLPVASGCGGVEK